MKEYRVAMVIATAIVVLIGICVLSYLLTPYRHGEASLFIDTYGDSITDQGSYGTQTSHCDYQRNNYQRHLYDYLLLRGVESVISNFGIGGQLITQICNRYLYAFTSAKYIIFMAGTNDVLSGGPQNITELILSQYARILNGKKHIFICSIPPVARHNDIIPGKSEELSKVIVNVNDSLEQFLRHRHDVTPWGTDRRW